MQHSGKAAEASFGPVEIAGGLVGGVTGAFTGSTIGALLGSIFGPIGTAVGFTVGGKFGAGYGMIRGAQNPGRTLLSGATGAAGFIDHTHKS